MSDKSDLHIDLRLRSSEKAIATRTVAALERQKFGYVTFLLCKRSVKEVVPPLAAAVLHTA